MNGKPSAEEILQAIAIATNNLDQHLGSLANVFEFPTKKGIKNLQVIFNAIPLLDDAIKELRNTSAVECKDCIQPEQEVPKGAVMKPIEDPDRPEIATDETNA